MINLNRKRAKMIHPRSNRNQLINEEELIILMKKKILIMLLLRIKKKIFITRISIKKNVSNL